MRQLDFKASLPQNNFFIRKSSLQGVCVDRVCVCVLNLYLFLCDFSGGFFEERGPGREKVLFGVLLQATVATAHRAIPRHLRETLLH